jgi:hypothetical protein
MKKQIPCSIIVLCLLCACTGSAQQAQDIPKASNANPDARLLADFKTRVDEYAKLREGLAPPLKKTDEPGDIQVAEKALAQKIRAARASAKRDDILTPATQAMFRRLLAGPLKGPEGPENKEAIRADAPQPKDVPFKVNGDYPKDESLSTVPPDVLRALPTLPEHLEYRFVGKHLILYDVRANLIVDYMLNAIP